jgi:tape measure domain-containing protein
MSIRKDTVNLEIRINGENAGKNMRQLTAEASKLKREMRELDPVTKDFQERAAKLKSINTTLSDISASTRAVGRGFSSTTLIVGKFIAAYASIGAIKAFGVELFNQIKRINSLNAAYKLLIPETDKRARADAFLAELANNYGLELNSLRDEYIKYNASAKASNLTLKDQELVFESVAKAGAVLGLSVETQNRAFTALQQIMSKGKVSAEELKGQLGDALPGAVTIMAKALGVGTGELQKMLETGQVMADDALPKFARELQKAYGVDQVKTIENISSAQNRFKNQVTQVVTAIGDLAGPLITRVINGFTEYGKKIQEIIAPTKTASEETRLLQAEFNNEIGVLKRLSPEAQGRKELIDQINLRYKEYLPNLIKETSSIKDIEEAQRGANKVFQEKLIFLAFEEEYKKQIDRTKEAVKQLASTEIARARSAQANQNLGQIGASPGQLEAQRKANESFIGAVQESAEAQINNNDKVVAELEAAYEKTAQRIGSTLDTIRKKFASTTNPESTAKSTNAPVEEKTGKAKKDTSNDFFRFDIFQLGLKAREEALKAQQQLIEDQTDKELDILLRSKLQGEITEQEYALRFIEIKKKGKEQELLNLTQFNEVETNGYRDKYNELLQLDIDFTNETINQRLERIQGNEDVELDKLQQKFLQGLVTEEEYEDSRLRLQITYFDLTLALLKSNGQEETEEYKKIQNAKTQALDEQAKKRIAIEEREAKIKQEIQSASFGAFDAFVDLAISASSRETAERKKNADLIKKFETARILVNLYAEIAGYYKANAGILGAGQVLSAIQSVAAAARAASAIVKVNSQKFQYGGLLNGPSHTHGGIPITMGGVQAAEAEGGEAFINKRSTAAFRPILSAINSFNGWGRKFETGGVLPGLSISPSAITAQAPTSSLQSSTLERKFEALIDLLGQGLDVRAAVVYTDIEAKSNTINSLRAATRT